MTVDHKTVRQTTATSGFTAEYGDIPLHQRLLAVRQERGIGQSVVAAALNLSVSEISRIERGKRRLFADRVGPWCAALGVQYEHVIHTRSPRVFSNSRHASSP